MANERNRQKAQPAGSAVQSTTSDATMPSAEPPAASVEQRGANAMTDTMPMQPPPTAALGGAGQGAGSGADDVPTQLPSEAAGITAGAVGAWLNDKRVTALWTINQNRNAWAYIAGVGWKKLANNSDTAVVALTMLAAHAKQAQTNFSYRDEADGMIHETYVW
jgi:hypothetical protein